MQYAIFSEQRDGRIEPPQQFFLDMYLLVDALANVTWTTAALELVKQTRCVNVMYARLVREPALKKWCLV
jgi:hypothetical protein